MTDRALITGASAGLGRQFAKLFAADGVSLILVARRRQELDALAGELRDAHGVDVLVLDADLSSPSTPAAIQDAVEREGLSVDVLVNNAGFGSNGPFAELDLERELAQIQVNVTSLVHLTRLFVPAMLQRGRGKILNVGSTAGFQPGPFMAVYYATKAFVNHFSEALAVELAGTGVTVTVSCPGPTATEFAAAAGNTDSKLFKLGAASAEDVAGEAYRAMQKGQRLIVHGVKNKLALQSLRVSPRATVLGITARLNRP